ncbi:hypothetical protein Ancab_014456 [Ancistrocladus abbreviatus]
MMFKHAKATGKQSSGTSGRRRQSTHTHHRIEAYRRKGLKKSKAASRGVTQLSGIPIGDSSIQNMNTIFLQKHKTEATKIWNLGKWLGASFSGEEDEIIAHICKLEAQDQLAWDKLKKNQAGVEENKCPS